MGKKYRYPHKDASPIEDVISLFDFFCGIIQNAETAVEDYLSRGKTLITLAKEQFNRRMAELNVNSFEEQLFSVELKGEFLAKAIAKKVIRPILKSTPVLLDSNGNPYLDTSYEPYAQMMNYLSEFELGISVQMGWGTYGYRLRRFIEAGDRILHVTYKEKGEFLFSIYGLKDHTHPKGNENILFRNGDTMADIAEFLAYLMITAIFKRTLKDESSEEYGLFKDYYIKHYSRERRQAYLRLFPTAVNNVLSYSNWKERFEEIDIFDHKLWIIPKDCKIDESFLVYLKSKGIITDTSELISEKLRKAISDDILCDTYKDLCDVPLILDATAEKAVFNSFVFDYMKYNADGFRYSLCLSRGIKSGCQWSMPQKWSTTMGIIETAFQALHDKTHTSIIEAKALRTLADGYARSFETKRNINKSTLESMEKSIFNQFFGYVEFDNDVDLTKVAEIAQEFKAFYEKYLNGIDSTENAIRFRKLGNHKASGLYYPNVKCLCVDINSPTSLVHEYGHLIDYCYGSLSRKSEFRDIRVKYEYLLRKATREPENREFAQRLSGKSKYNLDYYLTPTEIFARSFEIYFRRILEVDNNLTPSCFGPEYPDTEEFNTLVKEYFDSILGVLTKDNKVDGAELKAASK